MSDTSMEDLLTDVEPVVETKAEPEVTPEGEPKVEPEKVADAPEVETPEVAEEMVPQKALHEERKKRQELQDQVNLLLPKLVEINGQTKPKEPPKAPVSFSDDPEAFTRQEIDKVNQAAQARYMDLSEANAKARYDDYDDMFKVFEGLVKQEPVLIQKMMEQPDPADWAYRTAKQAKDLAELGDPSEFRERTRAEIRAEIEAEIASEADKEVVPAAPIPKTLAKTRNVGSRKGPGWSGPETLDEILK